MKDLIERLEKAIGPDRELDFWCWWYGASTESRKTNPQPPPEDYVVDNLKHNGSPRFTGSFDAAKTLIPAGLYWHAGEGKTRADEPLGAASIIAPGTLETIAEAEHASVIIALCIAALASRPVPAEPTPAEVNTAIAEWDAWLPSEGKFQAMRRALITGRIAAPADRAAIVEECQQKLAAVLSSQYGKLLTKEERDFLIRSLAGRTPKPSTLPKVDQGPLTDLKKRSDEKLYGPRDRMACEPAPASAEEWQHVPKKPDSRMKAAGAGHCRRSGPPTPAMRDAEERNAEAVYLAMLATAPSSPPDIDALARAREALRRVLMPYIVQLVAHEQDKVIQAVLSAALKALDAQPASGQEWWDIETVARGFSVALIGDELSWHEHRSNAQCFLAYVSARALTSALASESFKNP
jgi:hypothetical protein